MSDIVIQDNFLHPEYFRELETVIYNTDAMYRGAPTKPSDLVWSLSDVIDPTIANPDLENYNNGYQFVHPVFAGHQVFSSGMMELFGQMFNQMKMHSLSRCKINLTPRANEIQAHGMHIDLDEAPEVAKTSLLYINTNNGYTEFETGEKVSSLANRLVTFPNNMYHTGTTNTCNEPFRCVINIDWIPKGESFG